MKTIKYTAVALAMIAAASFTSSAKAANAGDLILGIYDTSGTVSNSYELDLGAYSTLTAGETFNIGNSISSVFGSSTTLAFDIAGSTTSLAAAGGLAKKEVVLTANMLPPLPASGGNGSQITNIQAETNAYASGTAQTAGISIANTTNGSFSTEVQAGGGSYGYGGGTGPTLIETPFSTTASASLYAILNQASSQEVATPTTIGGSAFSNGDFFKFSGTSSNVTLTFDPAAVPEPSAYALGLCAVALFWVLNRRRSVA